MIVVADIQADELQVLPIRAVSRTQAIQCLGGKRDTFEALRDAGILKPNPDGAYDLQHLDEVYQEFRAGRHSAALEARKEAEAKRKARSTRKPKSDD